MTTYRIYTVGEADHFTGRMITPATKRPSSAPSNWQTDMQWNSGKVSVSLRA
jgi:hypothetical protein